MRGYPPASSVRRDGSCNRGKVGGQWPRPEWGRIESSLVGPRSCNAGGQGGLVPGLHMFKEGDDGGRGPAQPGIGDACAALEAAGDACGQAGAAGRSERDYRFGWTDSTIARIALRIGSGSVGQATTRRARRGSPGSALRRHSGRWSVQPGVQPNAAMSCKLLELRDLQILCAGFVISRLSVRNRPPPNPGADSERQELSRSRAWRALDTPSVSSRLAATESGGDSCGHGKSGVGLPPGFRAGLRLRRSRAQCSGNFR